MLPNTLTVNRFLNLPLNNNDLGDNINNNDNMYNKKKINEVGNIVTLKITTNRTLLFFSDVVQPRAENSLRPVWRAANRIRTNEIGKMCGRKKDEAAQQQQ